MQDHLSVSLLSAAKWWVSPPEYASINRLDPMANSHMYVVYNTTQYLMQHIRTTMEERNEAIAWLCLFEAEYQKTEPKESN